MDSLMDNNRHFSGCNQLGSLSWLAVLTDFLVGAGLFLLLGIFSGGFSFTNILLFAVLAFALLWTWSRLKWFAIFSRRAEGFRWIATLLVTLFVLALMAGFSVAPKLPAIYPTLLLLSILTLLMALWRSLVSFRHVALTLYKSHFISFLTAFILLFFSIWVDSMGQRLLWAGAIMSVVGIPSITWLLGRYPLPRRGAELVSRHLLLVTAISGFAILEVAAGMRPAEIPRLLLFLEMTAVVMLLWRTVVCLLRANSGDEANHIRMEYGFYVAYIPLILFVVGLKFGVGRLALHAGVQPMFVLAMVAGAAGLLLTTGVLAFLFGNLQQLLGVWTRLAGGVLLLALVPFLPFIGFASMVHLLLLVLALVAVADWLLSRRARH